LVPPWLEVVTDGCAVHAVTFGGDSQFDELARCELFSGRFVSQFQCSHQFFLLLVAIASAAVGALPYLRCGPTRSRGTGRSGSPRIRPRLAGMAQQSKAPTLVQITDTVHLPQGQAV